MASDSVIYALQNLIYRSLHMAGNPHDKTGKQCAGGCGKTFDIHSLTLTMSKPKCNCLPHMDEKICVCGACYKEGTK